MLLSCFGYVWLFVTVWTVAYQAPLPWDFPDKNTGVGCHALLHGIFPPKTEHISCIIGAFFAHWVTWEALTIPYHAIYYTQNHAFMLKYYYNILKQLKCYRKVARKIWRTSIMYFTQRPHVSFARCLNNFLCSSRIQCKIICCILLPCFPCCQVEAFNLE